MLIKGAVSSVYLVSCGSADIVSSVVGGVVVVGGTSTFSLCSGTSSI